jgi:hypothetical protein
MTTHELKCWPEYFADIASGRKNFEIRLNDRNFQVGDCLTLREWNPATSEYTGKTTRRWITYITSFPDGLRDGYVCMELET